MCHRNMEMASNGKAKWSWLCCQPAGWRYQCGRCRLKIVRICRCAQSTFYCCNFKEMLSFMSLVLCYELCSVLTKEERRHFQRLFKGSRSPPSVFWSCCSSAQQWDTKKWFQNDFNPLLVVQFLREWSLMTVTGAFWCSSTLVFKALLSQLQSMFSFCSSVYVATQTASFVNLRTTTVTQ